MNSSRTPARPYVGDPLVLRVRVITNMGYPITGDALTFKYIKPDGTPGEVVAVHDPVGTLETPEAHKGPGWWRITIEEDWLDMDGVWEFRSVKADGRGRSTPIRLLVNPSPI
jgi:hypothetical protein